MSCDNALTIDVFHGMYAEIPPDNYYWDKNHEGYYWDNQVFPGDVVISARERYERSATRWTVVAVGGSTFKRAVLLERPSTYRPRTVKLDRYWSYGLNERGESVVRRIMQANNVKKLNEEEQEERDMCGCRRGYCYCASAELSFEVNEHSMTIDLVKGSRTLRLSLEECAEAASYLASAKTKIKEAKLAVLKEQQDELAKQLQEIEAL